MERQIERRLGELLDRVPGYRGYRAKEDRRDADRRVREHVATAFGARADRIERIAADLANQRRLADIGPVDEFGRTLRHLIDRVRASPSGYGGLFGDRDVDAAALDQLRRFDEGLLVGVEEVDTAIGDLESALTAGGDLAAPARAGTAQVRAVLDRLDLRGQVVETGKPVSEERALAVLDSPGSDAPPPTYGLREGDALAILGDNFMIDARIEVAAEPESGSLRLFRLGPGKPERWLVVPRRGATGLALVSPVVAGPDADVTAGVDGQTTIAGAAYTAVATAAGDGEVVGVGGGSGRRPVGVRLFVGAADPASRAVVLDWDGEQQVLTGTEAHPADIEVFGRASPP